MKTLFKDLKQGIIKIKITDPEDLWYLSDIVEEGDLIKGQTERKIKIGEEPNVKTVRKTVFLEINVEKTEYEPGSLLKVLGKVTQGPEDVSTGSYHSFNIGEESIITVKKESWPSYLLKKLEEGEKAKSKALLVVFDREQGKIAELTNTGYKIITSISGDVQKKQYEQEEKGSFYKELAKKIEEHAERKKYDYIVIASPAFWNEYLEKELTENVKKQIVKATVSSSEENAFKELLKREELKKAFKNYKSSEELKEIERILEGISKDKACYGFKDCKEKVELGAVDILLVSDSYLKKAKKEGRYKEIDFALKQCETMKGKVTIISGEEGCEKIDSLGGIAGLLRWKV